MTASYPDHQAESFREIQAYRQGYRDGRTPKRCYDPCPTYGGTERDAYSKGFDAGVDDLIAGRDKQLSSPHSANIPQSQHKGFCQ